MKQYNHVILKSISGGIIFGKQGTPIESDCVIIKKPYTYVIVDEGIGMAPYDSNIVQGELEEIKIPHNNIIYMANFEDCKEAFSTYQQSTGGIIMPPLKQILT